MVRIPHHHFLIKSEEKSETGPGRTVGPARKLTQASSAKQQLDQPLQASQASWLDQDGQPSQSRRPKQRLDQLDQANQPDQPRQSRKGVIIYE